MTRDSAAFIFCLVLAIALLALNKLSRKYIDDIRAHVTYVNMPKGKVASAPLPSDLTFYIETTGFKLIWAKVQMAKRIEVDLTKFGRYNFLATKDLMTSVASQLSSDYKLIQIVPDTLFFQFEQSLTKKIAVSPDIQIHFKKQFDFREKMLIKPDSVEITGPEDIVYSIAEWKTSKLSFQDMDKSVQGKLELLPPDNGAITLKPNKIDYTIAVEEYTEKSLEIEIERINMPKGKDINIYPKKVKLVFRVGMSNYELVKENSFSAVADFSGIEHSKNYVVVKIEKQPPFIKNLDYSPKSVEFIIYN